MGAGTDKVEARDVFALVVEAEPGGLCEDRRDGKAGAVGGEQFVAEVGRGDVELGDEVLVEVPPREKETVGAQVVELMRTAADLDVPLEVNVSWGHTWAAAKG